MLLELNHDFFPQVQKYFEGLRQSFGYNIKTEKKKLLNPLDIFHKK